MKEKILNDYLLKQQKIDIEKVMDDFYSYVYIIARNSVSTCITEEDIEEILDFDEEAYRKEQEQKHKEKMKQYEKSLGILLEQAVSEGEISLLNLQNKIHKDEITSKEIQKQLIPSVEMIRNKEIDIEKIKRERSEFIQEQTEDFQLSEMLLQLSESRFADQKIRKIEVYRIEDGNTVTFDNVQTEVGETKSIRCSNILIRIVRNEE